MTIFQSTIGRVCFVHHTSLELDECTCDIPNNTLERHAKFRDRARLLGDLASVLFEYYRCNGALALLAAVHFLYQEYGKLIAIGDPLHISDALGRMGDVLIALYERDWDPDILEKSIRVYQRAISCSESTSPGYCDIEVGLAWALWHRYQYHTSKDDCIKAVQMLEAARDRVGMSDAGKARVLATLGRFRFQSTTRSLLPATSQHMLEILATLVGLPKDNLPRSQYITCFIAEAYLNLYLSAGSLIQKHLDDGFRAAKQALNLCPGQGGAMRLPSEEVLCDLHFYASLHCRNDRTAWESHMKSAIEVADRMKSYATPDSPCHKHMYHIKSLNLLGMTYGTRSDRLGDLDGMEKAVSSLKQAVSMCPPTHASRPRMLNNLAAALGNYHQLSGRISVLDESIALYDFGLEYLIQSPFLATNIAAAMQRKARISDFNTATILLSRAIELCQSRKKASGFAVQRPTERIHVDVCMMRAVILQIKMGIHPVALDPAYLIQIAREDVQLLEYIPAYDFSQIELVLAQGELLKFQAIANDDVYPLDEAEQIVEAEINMSGRLVALRWTCELLSMQADLLVTRSSLRGNDDTLLTRAWETYQRAIQASQTDWYERFQTCLQWASQATQHKQFNSACNAFTHAITLLPEVVFLGEDVIARIDALRQVSGLSASSVAVALSLGQIDVAVDFLENTRGILWSQSLQARAPQLMLLPDGVRDHFVDLVRDIEQADRLQLSIRRRRAEELQKAILQIRALPGFDRFLLPPLLAEIESALQRKGGYAIVITLSQTSCDVLTLGTARGHSHMRLGPESVNTDRLRETSLAFGADCSRARNAQRKDATSRKMTKAPMAVTSNLPDAEVALLAELWVSLVRPIIKHLNIRIACNNECRKRVWLCPIGVLGSLPLHAAGIYDGPSRDSMDNYVISSYTPTLSALHRLLEEESHFHNLTSSIISPSVLLVAQPDAADLPLLPNAEKEAELIRSVIPLNYFADQPDSRDMSVDSALEGASTAHVIHLACHGHQDQENPLNSGFDLKDGRLTLGQLMRARAPYAQLAYLSACESAAMDQSRPDEGLNLVGAMIFAGFKSVIGTMWAMDDIDGPFMAERIYSRIFRDGVLDMTAVPYAVDGAVRELRESGVPASRWATYVHFGV